MYCETFYNVVNAMYAAIGPSQLHQTRLDTTLDFVLLLVVLHSFPLFLILPLQCNSILGRQGKVIRILEWGKFWLVDSGIPGFGFQNTAQGIWNSGNEQNPESLFHYQGIWNSILESRIHCVESAI